MTTRKLQFGCGTDRGWVRETNEDAFVSLVLGDDRGETGIFAVFDGMGGGQAGVIAAQTAAREIMVHLISAVFSHVNQDTLLQSLVKGTQITNDKIMTLASNEPELRSMGTTATTAVIRDGNVYIGHVGDCAAYLIADNQMEKLTISHTMRMPLVACVWPQSEKFEPVKIADVLYRLLGQTEDLEVDTHTREIPVDSWLLLRSDGLSRHVNEDEIHRIILAADSPQAACDQLIALANERGGEDNTTVIVVRL